MVLETYWLLVSIENVLFGEEPHTVHETDLTVALLSKNIDAMTLASTHNTHTTQNTHREAAQRRDRGERELMLKKK